MSIENRKHRFLVNRGEQIRLNRLAATGGRPYVEARLERAANESDLSWFGTDDNGRKVVTGRKDRPGYVNDAARVCQKIEQYLFGQQTNRPGASQEFLNDVTGTGLGIDAFMQEVCREITIAGWCWIQVDRAAWNVEAGQSVKQKQESGDRVRWTLWNANTVVDWHFNADGSIGWLLTEGEVWTDDDPEKDAAKAVIRTLFRIVDDKVVMSEFLVEGKKPYELKTDEELTGLKHIPFVCVGIPSSRPWWFDEVEAAQCQCLNLGSLHNETLVGSVFPQLVISETTISNLETKFRKEGKGDGETIKLIRELVRGRNHPIVESGEDKGSSRFIEPSGNGLKLIPEEQGRIRSLMFENAGLSLFNRESRQVQSAESKQFDQLDTNATLGHRAMLLQHAEMKLIELSVEFDSTFTRWDPEYPSKFDVFDPQGCATVISTVMNMPRCTLSMQKMSLIAGVRLLQTIATFDKELVDAANSEIDELAKSEDIFVDLPPTDFGGGGEEELDEHGNPIRKPKQPEPKPQDVTSE